MVRISVEGCDKTWKSTLVAELVKELKLNVIKTNAPKTDNPFEEYMEVIRDTERKNVILDRFFVGENVYGPIYRDKWLTEEQFNTLSDLTKKDIHILCQTDVPTIIQKFREDGEEFTKEEDVEQIVQKFQEEYKKLDWMVFIYDYKKNTIEQLLAPITNLLKHHGI